MRQLLILLLFIPSISFAKAILWLDIASCRTEEFTSARIKVFKDDTLVFDSILFRGTNVIKDLNSGDYKISYINYLDQEIVIPTTISETRSNSLKICIDKLSMPTDNFKGLIDSLRENESLTITSSLPTHYGNTKSVLTIEKQNGQFLAKYKKQIFQKGKRTNLVVKSKILSDTMILKIRQFEYELALVNENPKQTLTREFYTLQKGQISRKYIDTTYEWKGIWILVKELF